MSSILGLYLHPVSDVFDALQKKARIQIEREREESEKGSERGGGGEKKGE
jgi:hypothetical protein